MDISPGTKPDDSSRPEFWDVRYSAGETPWDFHGVPATLKDYLKISRRGRVLIPGCGSGYEVRAFHQASWDVTAIDFSPVAVERARSELGALASHIVKGDFFTQDFGAQCFDLIYERTFLCALTPTLRDQYAARVTQLLRPYGSLAGFFFYGEEDPDGPPFPLPREKAVRLFEKSFRLRHSEKVNDLLPIFDGREEWQRV